MSKKFRYILAVAIMVLGLGAIASSQTDLGKISAVTSAPPAQTKPVTEDAVTKIPPSQHITPSQIRYINTLNVVKNPNAYLNKRINCVARFDKFATLGLDYKPAFRSSETYISFLIFRPDTDKNIPLPEMKLFIKRSSAEKLIDLKEGDKVKFDGIVFSNALGDVWVDVETLAKIPVPAKSEVKK